MALGIGLGISMALMSAGDGLPSDGNNYILIGDSGGILVGASNGIEVS